MGRPYELECNFRRIKGREDLLLLIDTYGIRKVIKVSELHPTTIKAMVDGHLYIRYEYIKKLKEKLKENYEKERYV